MTQPVRSIDLHVHTDYSDGTLSPAQVVEYSIAQGLAAIAITDHDSVEAIPPALAAAVGRSVEVIPGIELSADDQGREIHILGLLIEWRSPLLQERLAALRAARRARILEMISRLNRRGIALNADDVLQLSSGDASLGRLHVARALCCRGIVGSIPEAFTRFIGSKGPCYVPHAAFSAQEAIALVRAVDGIPVLAHPGISLCDELISQMVVDGLRGIEIMHSEHSVQAQLRYTDIARAQGLLFSGGSDCHGTGKGAPRIGSVRVPYEYLEAMKRAKETGCRLHAP
ncbi:MAG: PHP domain-containing protein [Candidatus Omnitrophica bacterium]|nr:PHP domain-containing protein [Candidatus Omnitrophota bacterium]